MWLTEVHLAFFMAAVVLALAPGPDNLFVLLHSARYGARSGLLVVLGLCTGLLFHTAGVALGLAALLAATAWVLWLFKGAGAAYLLWLAWLTWRAPSGPANSLDTPALSAVSSYRRGVWMNLSNPKVAVFFLAFLPQFVQTDTVLAPWQQILWLGGLFILATLLVFGAVALGAGHWGQRWLASSRAQTGLNRLAALLFTALALRLFLT